VLTASAPISSRTASIWAVTKAGVITSTPVTPIVFWTVRAVTAEVPKTPSAENVLRSAWMPAPPPESEPAIVSAVGSLLIGFLRGGSGRDRLPLLCRFGRPAGVLGRTRRRSRRYGGPRRRDRADPGGR